MYFSIGLLAPYLYDIYCLTVFKHQSQLFDLFNYLFCRQLFITRCKEESVNESNEIYFNIKELVYSRLCFRRTKNVTCFVEISYGAIFDLVLFSSEIHCVDIQIFIVAELQYLHMYY